jgi:alginate O-acetyltransferase complex protein AlgI
MLFNSIHFVGFFLIVTSIYFASPHRYRAVFLLFCSCYFYMAFVPIYIVILGATIVLDFFLAQLIHGRTGHTRKVLLLLSLIANIGILAVFKYYNFFNENLQVILGQFGIENPIPFLNILLPIGLSFHTFQAMSYIIEVYRGHQLPERNFVVYALYVMFFPQLVAGPIERPQNLLYQFRKVHSFEYAQVADGLKLMAWGFFKKVVVADRLALMVNFVYDAPADHQGLPVFIATICFALQIYCDFSGYSDIALGAARVLGFKLMTNFNTPYFSYSIGEFWQRWHISLSTWFRDYVYIPLGGNRVATWRWQMNLMIVFLISGLWHGASWTFVIWGGLHGLYLAVENLTSRLRTVSHTHSVIKNATRMLTTFLLVCFAWIFFRSPTLADAWQIIRNVFSGWDSSLTAVVTNTNLGRQNNLYLGLPLSEFLVAGLGVLVLLGAEIYQRNRNAISPILAMPKTQLRWVIYYILLVCIGLFGVYSKPQQFIYFQF